MRRLALGLLIAGLLAAPFACAPRGPGVPSDALDRAIASAIGDPNTCVLLSDAATGRRLYSYGEDFNCVRALPACDRPGALSARKALDLAVAPGGRAASCASSADGSRSVGWAEGVIHGAKRDVRYSAVMEGERALPGREMAARLEDALRSAGL
jgi:hypothetical protein